MSIFEYDKEEEERKLRKAEYEAGREAGIQEIVQNMLRAGETPEKIARYTGCEIQELEKIDAFRRKCYNKSNDTARCGLE